MRRTRRFRDAKPAGVATFSRGHRLLVLRGVVALHWAGGRLLAPACWSPGIRQAGRGSSPSTRRCNVRRAGDHQAALTRRHRPCRKTMAPTPQPAWRGTSPWRSGSGGRGWLGRRGRVRGCRRAGFRQRQIPMPTERSCLSRAHRNFQHIISTCCSTSSYCWRSPLCSLLAPLPRCCRRRAPTLHASPGCSACVLRAPPAPDAAPSRARLLGSPHPPRRARSRPQTDFATRTPPNVTMTVRPAHAIAHATSHRPVTPAACTCAPRAPLARHPLVPPACAAGEQQEDAAHGRREDRRRDALGDVQ